MNMATEVRITSFEDFEELTVAEFNEDYAGGNPIMADPESTMYFTTIGVPYEDGYVVTIVKEDGEWWCEFTGDHETGVAQSDGHDTPQAAWEDSRARFAATEEE